MHVLRTLAVVSLLALPALANDTPSQNPEIHELKDRPACRPMPAPPRAVHRYQEILDLVPDPFAATNPGQWTLEQRATVNAALKKQLVDTRTPAVLHLRMADVAHWPGLTLHGDFPNNEGYPIRVFGGFDEAMQPQLARLKRGESVVLKGELALASFEMVWGSFTLSICLHNCSFARAPIPALPGDVTAASAGLTLISAVYGSGARFADVTRRVDYLLQQNSMEFAANPDWLDADPTPGWNKALVLVLEHAKKRFLYSTGEGALVSAKMLSEAAPK